MKHCAVNVGLERFRLNFQIFSPVNDWIVMMTTAAFKPTRLCTFFFFYILFRMSFCLLYFSYLCRLMQEKTNYVLKINNFIRLPSKTHISFMTKYKYIAMSKEVSYICLWSEVKYRR
jgi:hypothetical protein